MRIALLSNVNIELLFKKLSSSYKTYKPEGYGVWIQELMDETSSLYAFDPNSIMVLLDGESLFNIEKEKLTEEIKQYFSLIEKAIQEHPHINYFISNMDISTKRIQCVKEIRKEKIIEYEWYKELERLNSKYSNFYIFDIKKLVELYGRNDFYSNKFWYLGGLRFSVFGEKVILEEIKRYMEAIEGRKKKCVVLDLDHTLWGGIIGEDGMEGIHLSEFNEGARYKDFQKRLKDMRELGVVLAISSKNNYDDAMKVIDEHQHMILKKEDFAALKINWDFKVENITKLSEEMNIGLDSFVFIDDNPVERQSVKEKLPQVTVPDFPKDTSDLGDFATDIYEKYFFTLQVMEEDKEKTKMYIENEKRKDFLRNTAKIEDFFKTLETKIKIWKATENDVERIAQLSQKTNQFNLTTKRYLQKEIKELIKVSNYDLFVGSVEDKFGDNGKVFFIVIKKDKNATAYIDTFLMSCRIMGRFIEDDLIGYIENELRNHGYEKLVSYYYPTSKNKPVESLFDRLGYTLVQQDSNGNKEYELDLKKHIQRIGYAELMEL